MKEDFSSKINDKGLKGKYQKSVEAGLLKAYSELYPNYKIRVVSERDREPNCSKLLSGFSIYIDDLKTITPQKTIVEESVKIKFHPNLEAITFSEEMTAEEIQNSCNDYSYDNHKSLLERLEALAAMYALKGLHIVEVSVTNYGLTFRVDKHYDPNRYTSDDLWLRKQFDKPPISKSIENSTFKDIEKKVEEYFNSK